MKHVHNQNPTSWSGVIHDLVERHKLTTWKTAAILQLAFYEYLN